MMMTKQKTILVAIGLILTPVTYAALYNIAGTDYYVNGLPSNLTVKEKAKLISTTIVKTDAAIAAGKYIPLTTIAAKAKIKELNVPDSPTVPTTTSPVVSPPQTQPNSLMPAVDVSTYMTPAEGWNSLRIKKTTELSPDSGGDFRMPCKISHMNNDDVLLYPNQQGAAHSHLYFGNTSVDYKTDPEALSTTGNSTCAGGTMNRSAYWVPNMINIETNAPVIPTGDILVYYKHGNIDGSKIKAPPKGLRMIAGNMKAKSAAESRHSGFKCHPGRNSKRTSWPQTPYITPPSGCEVGDDLTFFVGFPQCWDGKNLDSPNHQDHMAYPHEGSCPATHPVPIPEIGYNVHYILKEGDKIDKWRLSSDNYAFNGKNAGYSGHGDWVNGWNEELMNGIIKNCINGKKDAHAHLLCDGRTFY